ncbi:MAG: helix-turn-helix domain-containing protein [Chitinophagaceae bacterium]
MTNSDIIRASDWVSVSEVAKRAGVSRQAIHQLITSGRLRCMRFGARSTMVHKRDAEQYIESKLKKAG